MTIPDMQDFRKFLQGDNPGSGNTTRNCRVFLFHQSEDADPARLVYRYLKSTGVEVDGPEYLTDPVPPGHSTRFLRDVISEKLDGCSHLLILVSDQTLFNPVFPWLMTWCSGKLNLSLVKLKGTRKDKPEYFRSVDWIQNTQQMETWISTVKNEPGGLLPFHRKSRKTDHHPLKLVLEH
ncbi:MAG: hypothetical protein L6Q77_05530 [Bacteroidetes bacterium]|nr:hypothetical protein [Bacteroidota bacterium]